MDTSIELSLSLSLHLNQTGFSIRFSLFLKLCPQKMPHMRKLQPKLPLFQIIHYFHHKIEYNFLLVHNFVSQHFVAN